MRMQEAPCGARRFAAVLLRWPSDLDPLRFAARLDILAVRLVVLEVVEQQVERDEPDLARELLEEARILPARLHPLLHRLAALRTRELEEHLGLLVVEARAHLARMRLVEMGVHGAAVTGERAIRARHAAAAASSTSSARSRTWILPSL